jgi:hypothetical protein
MAAISTAAIFFYTFLYVLPKLHIPPVLATHFKQRFGDLAEGTELNCFHQFTEYILVEYSYPL